MIFSLLILFSAGVSHAAFLNDITQELKTGNCQLQTGGEADTQHRYYSPHMGRFLSRDPAGDGLNLYALVNNGPVNNFDVFGLYGYMPEMPALPSLQQIMFLGPEAASQLADRQWATWERSVASTTSYYNDIARISAIGSIRAMDAVSAIRTEFVSDWAVANVKAQADAQAYMNSQRSYWEYGIGVGGQSSGQSAASQWTHGMLEGLGMAPGIGIPFDIANGLAYAYEGDTFNSALSFGAALPVLGYGANAFRGARYADEFIDFGRHYGDDLFGGGARYFDDVVPEAGLASTIGGEAMDPAALARIKKAFGRNGGIIQNDASTEAYLKLRGVEGLNYGPDTILLKQNPSRSSVFEELIHTAQNRNGRFNGDNVLEMEIEAAEKLIKFRRQYKIPNNETRDTINRLRRMRNGEL